jgi:hypothetical protein
MPMGEKSKRYASVNNPTINAVVHALYCLPTQELAREKLELIREHFILSAKQLPSQAYPSVHLWIKGFGLQEEDEAKGVIGHFALISYKKSEDKAEAKWLLLLLTSNPSKTPEASSTFVPK